MKILEQIKLDAKNAFKAGEKEKKLVLSLLVSEVQRNEPTMVNGEKTWTDEQSIKTIQKMMKDNILCNNEKENEFLVDYLPKKMSLEELTTLIEKHINEMNFTTAKDMGKVMNFLKQYNGLYDGKEASNIVKNILK